MVFSKTYAVTHIGLEARVQVECRNPGAVLSGNSVFTLRNHQGEVLDDAQWNASSGQMRFIFAVKPEYLGRQDLSVWLGEVCISAEKAYLYVSDLADKRLDRMQTSEPAVCLTIDCAGMPPERAMFDDLLDVLDKNGVKSTFFLTGGFVLSHPAAVEEIIARGHEIGNHSYSHLHMTECSEWEIQLDMVRFNQLMEEKYGQSIRLFRPPFGETDERVRTISRGEGMEEIMYNIDSCDWKESFTKSMIIERATNEKVVDGSVILFHLDNPWGAEVLDAVISHFREERGWRCLSAMEMLEASGRKLPAMPDR